ncbi:MAG: response regulator [Gemmatimonadetes bacterium]|nr:response regulator [Gemmatimonadota bacterium]
MKRKILLVEDNEDNRIIYRLTLTHFGYDVTETADGVTAIQLATEILPDVILMDVSIPGIDGWEATQILKADPRTAHIAIIAITAHALTRDRDRAREVGCDSYLTKPVEPRRVLEEIERLLGTGRTPELDVEL